MLGENLAQSSEKQAKNNDQQDINSSIGDTDLGLKELIGSHDQAGYSEEKITQLF